MKQNIMLDLETLGTKPGSVIVAIGAVKFDDHQILESFYERVDIESCVDVGLVLDPETVLWWMGQSDAARAELLLPSIHICAALMKFHTWVGGEDSEIWGNGASFDNALLSAAFDAAKLNRPWKYSNDRCYRTAKNLFPEIAPTREGTHHNALDDAKSQAMHLMKILRRIDGITLALAS